MTQEELIKEIRELPREQQERIVDAIASLIRAPVPPLQQRVGIVSRLRGIAKPEGPIPSDEELKEDYIRYLEKKYS